MTPAESQQLRAKAIAAAMRELCQDHRFSHFIDIIREQREAALDSLTDGAVIANERSSLACIGEIAAYKSVISIYDEARARAQQGAESATD